jgi:NAD(P) transhydrogenase subunit alpha
MKLQKSILKRRKPSMPEGILISLYVFVLAIFVGFEVITKVPPLLHTPLMSGSNAISGITIVGALISAGTGHSLVTSILGLVAVIFATINVVGGFMVTDRMLEMFKKDKGKK